jgi:hypothetical protein
MHFLPDTEDDDGTSERYWPDDFKDLIRKMLPPELCKELNETSLLTIYERQYVQDYQDIRHFVDRITETAVIGAENGADEGFESIYKAFLDETPLPFARPYARYLWPDVFSRTMAEAIHRAVVEDYIQDDGFLYAYRVGYSERYDGFDRFIDEAARLVVHAVKNGLDDMLGRVYRAFLSKRPLPPARRNPRRLKQW